MTAACLSIQPASQLHRYTKQITQIYALLIQIKSNGKENKAKIKKD